MIKLSALTIAAALFAGSVQAQTVVLDQNPAPAPTQCLNPELLTQSVAVSGGTLYVSTLSVNGHPGPCQPIAVTSVFAPTTTGVPQQAYNAVTTALGSNNLNMAAASLTGGSVLTVFDYTATTSGSTASTFTLPSVAAVVAAMKTAGINPVAGMTYELDVMNDQGTGTITYTLTPDTGATWTLAGTAQTIANGTMRKYLVTLTTLTAGTMQSLGEFTIAAKP